MALPDDLADFESSTREELSAAWQLHVSRVEEQLRAGWQEQIEQVLAGRFRQLKESASREVVRAAYALTERLNQTARRLRLAETTAEWRAIVEEVAAGFCHQAAIFDTGDPKIAKAPAFAAVIESKDTVVAMRLTSELSDTVTERFGERAESRCYLFPVLDGSRVRAVLYAEPGESGLDRNGLELLATLSGGAIPRAEVSGLIPVDGVQPGMRALASKMSGTISEWTSLSLEEQELHLRAQRFARVRVAEMRLYEGDAVRRGRHDKNLYYHLRGKIDAGREDFRREFLEKCPSMADYFHRELVRTLANEDPAALGAEYPGTLV